MGPSNFKFCPLCNSTHSLDAVVCGCGHRFSTQFQQSVPPPYNPPPANPTVGFSLVGPPGPLPTDLAELARRHRESHKLFVWTLIGGIFCLWPVLIVAYLEYNKMQNIRSQVVAMGVDLVWWQANFYTK